MSGSFHYRVVYAVGATTECKDILLDHNEPKEDAIRDALSKQHDVLGVSISRFYLAPFRPVKNGGVTYL